MIVVGPPGSGKRTYIRDRLSHKETTKLELQLKDGSTFQCAASPSHLEVIIPDNNQSTRDQYILGALQTTSDDQPSLIKEKDKEKEKDKDKVACREIVLWCAHRLSYDAQCALRRIMDDSLTGTEFILCTTHLDVIIEPIQSRCVIIRLKKRERDEMLIKWTEVSGETSLPTIRLPKTPAEVVELVSGWRIPPAAILLEMCLKHKITLEEATRRCIGCTRTYDPYMWLL